MKEVSLTFFPQSLLPKATGGVGCKHVTKIMSRICSSLPPGLQKVRS